MQIETIPSNPFLLYTECTYLEFWIKVLRGPLGVSERIVIPTYMITDIHPYGRTDDGWTDKRG